MGSINLKYLFRAHWISYNNCFLELFGQILLPLLRRAWVTCDTFFSRVQFNMFNSTVSNLIACSFFAQSLQAKVLKNRHSSTLLNFWRTHIQNPYIGSTLLFIWIWNIVPTMIVDFRWANGLFPLKGYKTTVTTTTTTFT